MSNINALELKSSSSSSSSMMITGTTDPSPHDVDVSSFEKIVLNISECFIYQIPPLRSTAGYRADEWNLANPLLTGYLRLYQADTHVRVVLYRYLDTSSRSTADHNLAVFAECPIDIKPKEGIKGIVDEVHDSSRYFVLRIKDRNSNKTVRLGIGFTERDTAFDFRCALNECIRYVDRLMQADALTSSSDATHASSSTSHTDELDGDSEHDASSASIPSIHVDLTIKEGQKIKISTKGLGSRARDHHHHHDDNNNMMLNKKLSPPPTVASPEPIRVDDKVDDDDVEWTDFTD